MHQNVGNAQRFSWGGPPDLPPNSPWSETWCPHHFSWQSGIFGLCYHTKSSAGMVLSVSIKTHSTVNKPASMRRLRLCRHTKLYFLTLTSQHTRVSPRGSCDVMVAGTSLGMVASQQGQLHSLSPSPLSVSQRHQRSRRLVWNKPLSVVSSVT